MFRNGDGDGNGYEFMSQLGPFNDDVLPFSMLMSKARHCEARSLQGMENIGADNGQPSTVQIRHLANV